MPIICKHFKGKIQELFLNFTDTLEPQLSWSRIRTIHQMSMVPVKRSEFSGNSSMSLPTMTASLRPAAMRSVSVNRNMTKYQPL